MKLTQNRLKELLHYNPETGIFTWKVSPTNRVEPGDVAGCIRKDGYVYIQLYGKKYGAHILAWLYMEGYFVENEIDHENRIKDDNRWDNLRHVSRSCNMRNRSIQSNNTSGVAGVSWCSRNKKWVSQIRINSKQKNLGRYEDFDEAVCLRLAAEQCLDWSGCDSNSTAYQYVKENIIKEQLCQKFA